MPATFINAVSTDPNPSQRNTANGLHAVQNSNPLNKRSEMNTSIYTKRHGEMAENRPGNRLKNIRPFDETRVILRDYPATEGSTSPRRGR